MVKTGITSSVYQKLTTAKIRQYGEILTVTRRDGTSQTLYAIPQPLPMIVDTVEGQGAENTANKQPHLFLFPGGSDVREQVDRVQYLGYYYRVTQAVPILLGNLPVTLQVTAIREGKLANG